MNTNRTLLLTISCAGLLGAPALAQTTVHSSASDSHDGNDKGTVKIVNSEDGKTVKATLKEGEIVEASVDGTSIDPKNITKDDEFYYLKDDSGKELGRLRRVMFGAGQDGDRGGHATVFKRLGPSTNGPGAGHGEGHGGSWVVEPGQRGGRNNIALLRSAEAAPKVMIGITMTQPDEVLADHFGIDAEEVTMIGFVTKDLPAEKAGLKRGDLIVALDGKTPSDEKAVRKALAKKNPGDTIVFSVIQKGQKKDITITLEAYDRKKLSLAGESDAPGVAAFDQDEMEKSIRESIERSLAEADSARNAGERARMAADRARELAERFRDRSGRWETFIAPAPPAPPTPPGAASPMRRSGTFVLPGNMGDFDHRMEELEARLEKLQDMLDRLAERLDERLDKMNERRERTPGGGGNAKPPADESEIELVGDDEMDIDINDEATEQPLL